MANKPKPSSAKAATTKKESARERLARERAAQEAKARRRRMIGVGAIAAAVLIVIVGIFAVIALNRDATPEASSSSYVQVMQNVPAASLDAVGDGGQKSAAQAIAGGQPEMKDGKPRFLYVGADYCPFCGIERWPLVIALSRFGTFSGLEAELSSPDEGQISNIPTVTFKDSSYTSEYLTFDAIETADRFQKPLDTIPAAEQKILDTYDPGTQGNPIPFEYWGTAHQNGASYDGTGFMPGVSGDSIAAKLSDTQSTEAKSILGAANIKTAQLCQLTGGKPESVCTSAGVTAAAKVLG